jgi:DNA-binding MarR family transcriptional regulator
VLRLGRLVARFYDVEMRPTGLEAGQFTLLATIRRVPGISQAQIARRLAMDTTSLTRTLAVLANNGWVEKTHGSDRRSRQFTITRAGEAQLVRARRHWQRAQQRFITIVGAEGAKALVEAIEAVAPPLNTQIAQLDRARRSGRVRKRAVRG